MCKGRVKILLILMKSILLESSFFLMVLIWSSHSFLFAVFLLYFHGLLNASFAEDDTTILSTEKNKVYGREYEHKNSHEHHGYLGLAAQ